MISRRRLLQLAGVLPFVSSEPSENPCAAKVPEVGELSIGPFGEDRIVTRIELTTRGDWFVETAPWPPPLISLDEKLAKIVHVQFRHGSKGAA